MDDVIEKVQEFHKLNAHKYIHELADFVRIPNNVFDPSQIQRNAKVLKEMMERRGIIVDLWPNSGGRPLVYGELLSEHATRTILIYGHYDGVPVDENEWHSNPYEPVLRDSLLGQDQLEWQSFSLEEGLNKFDDTWRIFGRSIADSKNAIVAILAALDGLAEQGIKPSVNIKFLFDGEEEVESPGLPSSLETYKEKIECDLVISASGETHQSGKSTVELGIRGMLQFDLTVYTTISELHSGHFGNYAPNAVIRMAHLLSSMKNEYGEVTISGFYDDVIPLSETEWDAINKIPRIEDKINSQFGISESEIPNKSLQELINMPTFNVRGFSGGYVGDSARNIVPGSTVAEIDIRLVKGMDPTATFKKIMDHIEQHGWTVVEHNPTLDELLKAKKIVKVIKKAGFPATRTSLDSEAAAFVVKAVTRVTGDDLVIMPTEGGSLPLYLFEQKGIPVIGLPTSNFDCNQHTNDENLMLYYFFRAIDIFAALFHTKF